MDNNIEHIVITSLDSLLSNKDNEVCYGYWQTYLISNKTDDYEPVFDQFIFYKGKFFDKNFNQWSNDDIEQVKLLSNNFNKDKPLCVFRYERPLN